MLAFVKNYGFHLNIIEDVDEDGGLVITKVPLGKRIPPFEGDCENFYVLTDSSFEVSDGEAYKLHRPLYFPRGHLSCIESPTDMCLKFLKMLSQITGKYYYLFPDNNYCLVVETETINYEQGLYEVGKFYFSGPYLVASEPPIKV